MSGSHPRPQPQMMVTSIRRPLPPGSAASIWTAATYRLIGDFERDLKACVGAQAQIAPNFIVMASDCLWEQFGPDACWSKLDLQQLRVLFAGFFSLPGLEERMAVELTAFYTFLAKFGHVAPEVTLRIHEALQPLTASALAAAQRPRAGLARVARPRSARKRRRRSARL